MFSLEDIRKNIWFHIFRNGYQHRIGYNETIAHITYVDINVLLINELRFTYDEMESLFQFMF